MFWMGNDICIVGWDCCLNIGESNVLYRMVVLFNIIQCLAKVCSSDEEEGGG